MFCKQIEITLGQFSKNQLDSNKSPQSKLIFWQNVLHPKELEYSSVTKPVIGMGKEIQEGGEEERVRGLQAHADNSI